ncbi:uncharacterized protein MEPE_02577 [Melanopsichium pennsylvanicum]|uniref:Uncharacterized protein n=2 Tax=Melanopsichium pennsylvanicum TaxID=63383 RepID=A0AAJ4XK83_9BASI|nr:major facilitator superfamily protein [Melanopsichium pennsylvanicum 4]SNX83869.1 uncharacterized protein MEPE_02577 [Melanopsichium pennsylvanicum]
MAKVELHKLNGDTSWLVRLPTTTVSNAGQSLHYNLVLDPWLHPAPQIDGAAIFSRQTRIEPAAHASLAQLDQWLHSQSQAEQIDAILFSHPFSDHLHPQTITDQHSLAILQQATVFTTADSLPAFRSLKLDSGRLVNLSSTSTKHDADQNDIVPAGIHIHHLPARDWALSPAWNKLHSGILISCSNTTQNHTVELLYSPHGITPTSIPLGLTQIKVKRQGTTRVLIHSFDRQTLPLIGTVACGFPNVLDLIPTFNPDCVLVTHDEHKRAQGIVGRLLTRKTFPIQHAQTLLKHRYPSTQCTLKHLAPGETISIP